MALPHKGLFSCEFLGQLWKLGVLGSSRALLTAHTWVLRLPLHPVLRQRKLLGPGAQEQPWQTGPVVASLSLHFLTLALWAPSCPSGAKPLGPSRSC